jgi:hypothetical protein
LKNNTKKLNKMSLINKFIKFYSKSLPLTIGIGSISGVIYNLNYIKYENNRLKSRLIVDPIDKILYENNYKSDFNILELTFFTLGGITNGALLGIIWPLFIVPVFCFKIKTLIFEN